MKHEFAVDLQVCTLSLVRGIGYIDKYTSGICLNSSFLFSLFLVVILSLIHFDDGVS